MQRRSVVERWLPAALVGAILTAAIGMTVTLIVASRPTTGTNLGAGFAAVGTACACLSAVLGVMALRGNNAKRDNGLAALVVLPPAMFALAVPMICLFDSSCS